MVRARTRIDLILEQRVVADLLPEDVVDDVVGQLGGLFLLRQWLGQVHQLYRLRL